MRALWIAIGVGVTAYFIVTHTNPVWIAINVMLDVYLIVQYLKER